MERSSSDMELYRQRADALKAKMTQAEPANRGPPLDPKDLDFLQSDNPTVVALKREITALERETSELDVAGGNLKRSDEFRKELKKKKERESRPPTNWKAAVGIHFFF